MAPPSASLPQRTAHQPSSPSGARDTLLLQWHRDSVSLAGDVTTALVGADWSTERWRAGAALSHSWGSGSYGGDNNDDADISTTLTGVFPYGRYGLTPRAGHLGHRGLRLG